MQPHPPDRARPSRFQNRHLFRVQRVLVDGQPVAAQRQGVVLSAHDDQLVIHGPGVPHDQLDIACRNTTRPHIDPEVLLADPDDGGVGRRGGPPGPARRGHGDEHRGGDQESGDSPHPRRYRLDSLLALEPQTACDGDRD